MATSEHDTVERVSGRRRLVDHIVFHVSEEGDIVEVRSAEEARKSEEELLSLAQSNPNFITPKKREKKKTKKEIQREQTRQSNSKEKARKKTKQEEDERLAIQLEADHSEREEKRRKIERTKKQT